MSHATYRVQLKLMKFAQVDIESDEPLTIGQIAERASEKAVSEFGGMDQSDMIGFEMSVTTGKGGKQ